VDIVAVTSIVYNGDRTEILHRVGLGVISMALVHGLCHGSVAMRAEGWTTGVRMDVQRRTPRQDLSPSSAKQSSESTAVRIHEKDPQIFP
jgi:hypothetical protein